MDNIGNMARNFYKSFVKKQEQLLLNAIGEKDKSLGNKARYLLKNNELTELKLLFKDRLVVEYDVSKQTQIYYLDKEPIFFITPKGYLERWE